MLLGPLVAGGIESVQSIGKYKEAENVKNELTDTKNNVQDQINKLAQAEAKTLNTIIEDIKNEVDNIDILKNKLDAVSQENVERQSKLILIGITFNIALILILVTKAIILPNVENYLK